MKEGKKHRRSFGFFKNESGQTELSFGMIFSIILIIAFIAFAFFGIKKLLDWRDSAQIGQFETYFQKEINDVWASGQGTVPTTTYALPSKIQKVCFFNYQGPIRGVNNDIKDEAEKMDSDTNMFFYPEDSTSALTSAYFSHINITETTKIYNPLCIDNKNGVKFTLQENYGENSVIILKP